MIRSLLVLSALLLACAVLSAPAPKPLVSGWGKPVDPSRDCKFSRSAGVLTIEMPGSDHDYDPIRKHFNAPRIICDLEGDFDIQVRIHIDCWPSARSTVKGQCPCVSAGLLLIYPDTSKTICDRFEFGLSQPAMERAGAAAERLLQLPRREDAARKGIGEDAYFTIKGFWYRELSSSGIWDRASLIQTQTLYDPGWLGWPLPRKTDRAYLRLEQSEKWLTFFISSDGESWAYLVHGSHPPTKLKLGLAAYSTSTNPSKVRFDQLKLTRPKKRERFGGPSLRQS